MELDHQKLPRPTGKVVKFTEIDTLQEAFDYALGGFHACVDKIAKTSGANQRLWQDAGIAYGGAYGSLLALKAAGNTPANVANARKLLADANHKADVAAATDKRS